jgi:hypothetical protein
MSFSIKELFNTIKTITSNASEGSETPLFDSLDALSNLLPEGFQNFVKPAIAIAKEALVYQDGIRESRFGTLMEESWVGTEASFISGLVERTIKMNGYTVRFSKSTPFDSSANSNSSLYGNLILGTPMIYTKVTDPGNRVMLNTFVKDASFLSLTPGMPKFNGSAFFQKASQTFSTVKKAAEKVDWDAVGNKIGTSVASSAA